MQSHRGFSAWTERQANGVSVPHCPTATTRRSPAAAARLVPMSVAPVRAAAAVPPSLRNARRSIDPAIALSSENPARRPGIRWLRMPVGPGLDAIEHHAREALDAMHLAGREDDRVPGTQPHLRPSIVEEPFALQDVVDLVGPRAGMEGRRLPRLPADDADRTERGVGQGVVHVPLF